MRSAIEDFPPRKRRISSTCSRVRRPSWIRSSRTFSIADAIMRQTVRSGLSPELYDRAGRLGAPVIQLENEKAGEPADMKNALVKGFLTTTPRIQTVAQVSRIQFLVVLISFLLVHLFC